MITKLLHRFMKFVTKELITIISFILYRFDVRSTHEYGFVTGNPSTLTDSKEFKDNLLPAAITEFSLASVIKNMNICWLSSILQRSIPGKYTSTPSFLLILSK